ncbi:MAG: helix-turn-helix transcriptional regulator [Bacteroidales bacterium]|nr:helix-turn-helix transcriptional regulator [Bacteroidales bacterium]
MRLNFGKLFSIGSLADSKWTEARAMRLYNIPDYAFSFLMEGEILVEVDGQSMLIAPGQFVLIPGHKDIMVRYFKDCKGYDGKFSIEFLKDASYPVLRSGMPLIQSFWFDDAVFIGALMHRMCTALYDKDKAFLQSGMDLILGQLRPGGKMAAVPEKFLQMVFSRKDAPMSVAQYASALGVTPNYLNKTVKHHTHRTAIDWIEIARLNLAKQLLRDPEVPIVDVAARTGLDDQSYFARFFKKKTGLTPSQFRNSE